MPGLRAASVFIPATTNVTSAGQIERMQSISVPPNYDRFYEQCCVGARIWALMGEGRALAEICATMLEEYEVERAQLEADVLRLTAELVERGLVAPA